MIALAGKKEARRRTAETSPRFRLEGRLSCRPRQGVTMQQPNVGARNPETQGAWACPSWRGIHLRSTAQQSWRTRNAAKQKAEGTWVEWGVRMRRDRVFGVPSRRGHQYRWKDLTYDRAG